MSSTRGGGRTNQEVNAGKSAYCVFVPAGAAPVRDLDLRAGGAMLERVYVFRLLDVDFDAELAFGAPARRILGVAAPKIAASCEHTSRRHLLRDAGTRSYWKRLDYGALRR